MTDLSRREALEALSAAAAGAGLFACAPADVDRAAREAAKAKASGRFTPRFFTAGELATATLLADLVIPQDERSGSASDAGVPEFMDFVLAEEMTSPDRIRGGLGWLERECGDRFGKGFVACSEAERIAVLDDIAWPARAKPAHSQGAAFFTAFRDLVAGAFWSSKVGVEDLGYRGNVPVAEWTGCPEEQLRKLGVSYS
jgi:gluconate 2-dehydrogenase gamma chain